MKIAGIASTSNRSSLLEQTIQSLYTQVDIIELALNDYTSIPSFLKKYNTVIPSLTTNEMGDANKFLNIEKYTNDYYFSCDDDIVYPPNYVERYVAEIDLTGSLITSHGSTIPGNIRSYYSDRLLVSHFLHDSVRTTVHIPGSGVSGFRTDQLKVKYSDFKNKNMADIFLGILCFSQGISCISIAHKKGWFKNILPLNQSSVYSTTKNNDSIQTNLINSICWT